MSEHEYLFDGLKNGTDHPAKRPGMVRRDDVLKQLTSATHAASLIVLLAPAGYGKTTVLSQWAAQDPPAFAWVSIDDQDNDPVRLLQRIATAVSRGDPAVDEFLMSLTSPGASPGAVLVPRLLGWLTRHSGDRVLVLDDLDRLHSRGSLAVIEALVSQLPPGWHLALAARTRPRLHLGPLRRQRRFLELGPNQLAFSSQEAGALLAEAGLREPAEGMTSLVRRTEGWPAGLYLAMLSFRTRRGAAEVEAIAGDDATFADYFRDRVLDREDAETVSFLLRTSVLERMSGPLCDAVLLTTGSAARLRDLEDSNLFVVPQDHHGEWYRYHQLFAEMLLAELRRREPAEELLLHRRAAEWFSEHESPQAAINHALAGRDLITAARLTTMCATPLAVAGQSARVRHWIEAMDDEGLVAYPPLTIIATWVWALEGEPAKAQRCLRMAENALYSGTPSDGSASLESGIRMIRGAMAQLGIAQMLLDGRRAVELEPPGSRWHPFASWVLGSAELLNGEPERAAKAFERAAYLGREGQKPAACLALAQLALLAADRGDWAAAAAHAGDAQELIRAGRLEDFLSSMLCYAASARMAAHQGDREAALRNIGNALRLYSDRPTPVAFPWLASQVAIVLGWTFLELDDGGAARLKVNEARRALAPLATQGILRDQLQRLADAVAKLNGSADAETETILTLTSAELRVLRLLPMHLTLAQIAQELGISRNTVKTHVAAVYRKLQATTRADAVRRARQLGLFSF